MKLLFCLLLTFSVFSQEKQRISGVIKDAKTKEVIPGANVYLEGTTIGTQADSLGHFTLKNIVRGRYQLVGSFVGYKPAFQFIDINAQPKEYIILLEEDNQTLAEVRVVAGRDKDWEKGLRKFERAFLGDSYNKKEVRLLNKEVLNFEEEEGRFLATAIAPLVIENLSLGYRVTYTLDRLEQTKDLTSFRGLGRYEFLPSTDKKQQTRWKENRKEAYLGSLSHFLKAMVENRLEAEGFNAYLLKPGVKQIGRKGYFYDISTNRHFPFQTAEVIKPYQDLLVLDTQNAIELVYNQRRVSRPIFVDAPYPYTVLIPKGRVLLSQTGNLMDPFSLEMRGDMGRIGMAELLPLDYTP
jgi:CarboxypepD_reg-like domain